MNIYLYDADISEFYFPGSYNGPLLEKIWNFDAPTTVYDMKDQYHENSLFILSREHFLSEFYQSELDLEKTERFRKIKNKKILLDCSGKTIHNDDAKRTIQIFDKIFFETAGFEPKNIYYIVQTKKDCQILTELLGMNINVVELDRWLDELNRFLIVNIFQNKHHYLTITKNLPKKKFSFFIRRYEEIRLHVFCELISKDLLKDFYYTFCSVDYSGKDKDYIDSTISGYIENLSDYTAEHKLAMLDWAKNIPYQYDNLVSDDYGDFYSKNLGPYYNSSDINFVVESHVECVFPHSDYSSLTEKTYKAMLYKKPFIIFSQKDSLQYLRDCGYKTFSPYIDESYDAIIDTKERLRAISSEIERIRNLESNDYNQLLYNCQNIVEHNYNLLLQNAHKPVPDNFLIKNMDFL